MYMKEIEEICDLFEDKSHFTPEEIVGIISDILEKNPELIDERVYKI